jgi:MSHA biogenesis protein MshL
LGYTFKIEDRTVYVSKPKLEPKVFTINYLALKKTSVSKVQWKEGGSSTTSSGTGTTSSDEKTLEIKSESETDLWKNLEDNLKAMMSPDGKFAVNRQAFTIIVTDYPKNLKRVSMLLDNLEGPMHRQILIEAKIVEVILNTGSRIGVNWQVVNARVGSLAQISATQFIPVPADFATDPSRVFRFQVGSLSSGDLNLANTYVDALQQEYKVEVLSSPKVATLNNQRAVIKATQQEVYFEQSQSVSSGGNLATYTPKFLNVGVVLDVIPQIDENNNIILSIHPLYSTIAGTQPYTDSTQKGGVPVVTTREADTVVRVKDGETVVIAGLIQERKFKDRTGIFGLANIPLLGPLFRADTEERRNTELVVFLTPRILHAK